MLVITRSLDEIIWIELPTGDRIKVQVVAMADDRVRIGIAAPLSCGIVRDEIVGKYDGARERARRERARQERRRR